MLEGGAPRERGRPARMHCRCVPLSFPAMPPAGHPAGGNGMGPVEAESWRRCRSSRVEELGEALPVLCRRDARAPGGLHPVTSTRQRRFIGRCVYSWFVFNNDILQKAHDV